jgi:hypothetical protein
MFCLPWDSFLVSNDRRCLSRGKTGLLKTLSCGGKYSMPGTLKPECSPPGRPTGVESSISRSGAATSSVPNLHYGGGIESGATLS